MPVNLYFPGLGVDKEKPGTFRGYPYAGGRLLKYALNLLAAGYVSEFFKLFLRNGVAVQTVRRRADINLVAMPVKGGCYHLVHRCTENIIYEPGCGDVE